MFRCLWLVAVVFCGVVYADPSLHRTEKFKYGSWAREKAEFQAHALKVLAAQLKLKKDKKLTAPGRVFHQKQHGCLTGKLVVREKAKADLRHGIFSPNAKKEYDVLVRFSNGVGHPQHDLKPDVRGIALKVFGVEDKDKPDLEVLDLLMTNAPNPFGRDQAEFVEFMEANVNPGFLGKNLAVFAAKHPAVAKQIVKRTLRVVRTLTKEQFWSGHPYLLYVKR